MKSPYNRTHIQAQTQALKGKINHPKISPQD